MATTTQLTDGLDRLVSNLASVVKPSDGYTFDLTKKNAVQIGRVMQLPNRLPQGKPPFVLIAFREEFQRAGVGTGKNFSRIAEFDVIGWVRGQDIPGQPNTYESRARAGTLLFDDLSRAIIADSRMAGLSRDVFIRGSGFAGDIIQPWKALGVAVGRVRVRFNWTAR